MVHNCPVIGSRQTRLVRVKNLTMFQRVILERVCSYNDSEASSCAVLVPTNGAVVELRRTLRVGGCKETLPALLTRTDWYDWMRTRLSPEPIALTEVEREVAISTACREALKSGSRPPFKVRPRLVGEIVGFYDELRRRRQSIDSFERLVLGELEPTVNFDHGAQRLLEQTHFLVSVFRAYERRRESLVGVDEHQLRKLLLAANEFQQIVELIVTVPDEAAHPLGLYPADFDLLTRLPNLKQITLIATDSLLDSGYRERLEDWLPGFTEERVESAGQGPALAVPDVADSQDYFVWRDREDELNGIAVQVDKRDAEVSAVVVQRPLPYVYLAGSAFDSVRKTLNFGHGLPLAVEPYVAAVDLVIDCVQTNFSRRALVALLASPHFEFQYEQSVVGSGPLLSFDRALSDSGFGGGCDGLDVCLEQWREAPPTNPNVLHVLGCALAVVRELEALRAQQSVEAHLLALRLFLVKHASKLDGTVAADRTRLVRDMVWNGLHELEVAYAQAKDSQEIGDFSRVSMLVHRWIENKTSRPEQMAKRDCGTLHIVDADAAIYGVFDDVFLAGLVDGEWLTPRQRNIFYPGFLLRGLGWPREPDCLRAGRAAFDDLMGLPRCHLTLSTFQLENDAKVVTSPLLDDLSRDELPRVHLEKGGSHRERVATNTPRTGGSSVPIDPQRWGRWYESRLERISHERFPAEPTVTLPESVQSHAVSSLERYLQCPFKYFAHDVLGLEGEIRQDDREILTSQERGRLLHDVLEKFFRRWQAEGKQAITLTNLEDALEQFSVVVDELIEGLDCQNRGLIRSWLLGSVGEPGVAERVFVWEIEDPSEVVERLLEYKIEGKVEVASGAEISVVELRGQVDRLDLYADNTFRVVDYKAGRQPQAAVSLQLPVYARSAEMQLRADRGGEWKATDAVYVAFGDSRTTAPLGRRITEAMETAQQRVYDLTKKINAGEFNPAPANQFLCQSCDYASVCRKAEV